MNQRLRVATAYGVLLLAGVTSATDSPAPTMPGHAGDSWSYYVDVTFTNMRNNVTVSLINGVLTRTVLESKVPARLLVQEVTKDFTPPRGVVVVGQMDAQPLSASYCADGTVDKIVDGVSSAAYRLINLETIKLPGAGIKLGLNWSWRADADPAKGTPALSAEYKVSEDGEYQGIPAWKIEFSTQELASNQELKEIHPAQMGGVVWLRKTDLVEVSVADEGSNLPVHGTDDLVRRKLTTSFIPELETHAPVVSTPAVQGP